MNINEKIRKYRTQKNLTQKELAFLTHMSEPAIRLYELGKRKVAENQRIKIANALGISPFAISDPSLDSYVGIMHVLFELEDEYGLKEIKFENMNSALGDYIREWNSEKEKLKANEITEEEYELWKAKFPQGHKFK